jgi:hypothetical protein
VSVGGKKLQRGRVKSFQTHAPNGSRLRQEEFGKQWGFSGAHTKGNTSVLPTSLGAWSAVNSQRIMQAE